MKIHMEAVTLLSVLFATATATADDAQQDRRLKPRKSKKAKKSKTDAPTPTPTEEPLISSTLNFRVVLDADPIVLVPNTDGPPPTSFIGSRSVITGRALNRDPAGNAFLPVLYTQICTITKGTFPNVIETNNCDISLCLNAPVIGGCAFYKSGGNFPFTIGQPVPTVIATKTGGTGVLNFDSGPEFLTISSTGTTEAINVDVTVILPRESNERNFMLAATVPGESQVILHFDDALSVPSSIQHTLNSHVYFSFSLSTIGFCPREAYVEGVDICRELEMAEIEEAMAKMTVQMRRN